MRVSIKTEGFEKWKIKLGEGAKAPLSKAVFKVATFMERTAKINFNQDVLSYKPKINLRTGKAQQSIIMQPLTPLSAKIYMGVNYGKYIEEGTGIFRGRKPYWTSFGGQLDHPILYKGMKARPFWSPAVKTTKANTSRILKEEMEKYLK